MLFEIDEVFSLRFNATFHWIQINIFIVVNKYLSQIKNIQCFHLIESIKSFFLNVLITAPCIGPRCPTLSVQGLPYVLVFIIKKKASEYNYVYLLKLYVKISLAWSKIEAWGWTLYIKLRFIIYLHRTDTGGCTVGALLRRSLKASSVTYGQYLDGWSLGQHCLVAISERSSSGYSNAPKKQFFDQSFI